MIEQINPTSAKHEFKIWLDEVNKKRKEHWDKNFTHKEYEPLMVTYGHKYWRVWDSGTCWGFISLKKDKNHEVGDLLKPASWRGPAKGSRGNILKGTTSWDYYGPSYLK